MARMSKGERIIRECLSKAQDDEEALHEKIKGMGSSLAEIRQRVAMFDKMLTDLEAPSPDSANEDDDGGD